MSYDDSKSGADKLRHSAETRLDRDVVESADLHELRVHQIELEMQSDELRRAEGELDAERQQYFNLFHRAPVGYLTLDGKTMVSDANVTASHLLGIERKLLIGQPFGAFVLAEDHALYDGFDRILAQSSGLESCELRLVRLCGDAGSQAGHFWARLDGRVNPVADDQMLSFLVTFADITERKHAEDALARSLLSVIEVVGQVVALRDPYTSGHEHRVSALAVSICKEMGIPAKQVEEIRVAALLHDVGKMAVPSEILSKPGKLTPAEFELVKEHAAASYRILVSADMTDAITEMVYQHHERCDGSGYPRGLHGDELSLGGTVLAVSDVVEAMCSHRPYRANLGEEAALNEIQLGAGRLYDARVVDACVKVFREGSFEFPVGVEPNR